jgi:hypothetical protein
MAIKIALIFSTSVILIILFMFVFVSKFKISKFEISKFKIPEFSTVDNISIDQYKVLELKRMAISSDSPKNTASRFIKIMTAIIKKNFCHIEKLISYQDIETHNGTIYKASGWYVGHFHKGGSWYRKNSGRLRPDLNGAVGAKIRWEKRIR